MANVVIDDGGMAGGAEFNENQIRDHVQGKGILNDGKIDRNLCLYLSNEHKIIYIFDLFKSNSRE